MLDGPDTQSGEPGGLFAHAQFVCLVNLIIEAIEHEVDQVGHHSLRALALQKLHQMIVSGGGELHQDLANNADSWLFDILYGYAVKIPDDLPAEPVKPEKLYMLCGDIVLHGFQPFFVQRVNAAGNRLIGAHAIDAAHKDIAEFRRHGGADQ